MKLLRRALSVMLCVAVAAALFPCAAFSAVTDSVTYSVFDGNGSLLYSDDFRLERAGAFGIFVPADAASVTMSPVTKNNVPPVYDDGDGSLTLTGDTGSVSFTVADESFELNIIKQNDANTLISDIRIYADGDSSETETGFAPFRFGYSAHLPIGSSSLSFEIDAGDGVTVTINGEAPAESYTLSGSPSVFTVNAVRGELSYNYTYILGTERAVSSVFLTLSGSVSDGNAGHFERLYPLSGSENYTVSVPVGTAELDIELERALLYIGGELHTDGAVAYSEGMELEARGSDGGLLCTVTVVNDYEIRRFPLRDISLTVCLENGTEKYGNIAKSISLADALSDGGVSVTYPSSAEYLCFDADFMGENNDISLTLNGEPLEFGEPFAASDGNLVFIYNDFGTEKVCTFVLAAGSVTPCCGGLELSCFDADGAEIANIIYGVNDALYIPADTEKVTVNVLSGGIADSCIVTGGDENGLFTFDGTGKIVCELGEDSAEYPIAFVKDMSDTAIAGDITVAFNDSDGGRIVTETPVTNAEMSVTMPYFCDSVTVSVGNVGLNQHYRLNGAAPVGNTDGLIVFEIPAADALGVLRLDVTSALSDAAESYNINVSRVENSTPVSSPSAVILCYSEEGVLLDETAIDKNSGFASLPEETVFYTVTADRSVNGGSCSVNGVYADNGGSLFRYASGQTLRVVSVSEDGTASDFCSVRLFKGNYLSDILIDGVSLEGFSPAKLSYNVVLPADTTGFELSAVCGGSDAKAVYESSVTVGTPPFSVPITVTLAGESEVYTLNIVIEPRDELVSETLDINRENGTVTGLTVGMRLDGLKALFENDAPLIKFYKNGEEVTSGLVATGIEIVLVDSEGNESDRLTLLVYGDITGDGRINTSDILAIIIHNANRNLTGVKLSAADITGDGRINSSDILRIVLHNNGRLITQTRADD